jgi:hypothetical protein
VVRAVLAEASYQARHVLPFAKYFEDVILAGAQGRSFSLRCGRSSLTRAPVRRDLKGREKAKKKDQGRALTRPAHGIFGVRHPVVASRAVRSLPRPIRLSSFRSRRGR